MLEPTPEYVFVDDARTLDHLANALTDANLLALDTEFVRESTYFPELCVLQIATPEIIAAVDCLAPINLDALFEILLSDCKTWILHSARQDLEVVYFRSRKLPSRLIDTQIAAALTGLPIQIGLQNLLDEMLGIRIGKQHTRANWRRRPLTDALIEYAIDDVRFLFALWTHLQQKLRSLGRQSWFEEECARQLALPIEPEITTLFERTKGTGPLKGKCRAAAYALLAWREARAKTVDRPRRWVLADDQLVSIALAAPESMTELKDVRGLPRRMVERSGREILAAIREAPPVADSPDTTMPDPHLVKSLQREVRDLAESLGIQSELLATRRDIAAAAAGSPPELIATGWRHDILGEVLGRVSSGQAS